MMPVFNHQYDIQYNHFCIFAASLALDSYIIYWKASQCSFLIIYILLRGTASAIR